MLVLVDKDIRLLRLHSTQRLWPTALYTKCARSYRKFHGQRISHGDRDDRGIPSSSTNSMLTAC